MLRIFNCPYCQGVFKAELEDGVSHLQCPHCEREIEASTLAAETHEPQSGEQASSESAADVPAETKPNSEAGNKPRMKVSESEVKRSILPPGFKDKVQNQVQDEVHDEVQDTGRTNSANDEQDEDSKTEDLESELAIPMPVSPEPESEVAENAEELNTAETEKESVENSGDDTDDDAGEDSAEDLVLPAVLENAAVIPTADQMLGDLASEVSPSRQSMGIHVIETDEEEEALIERVVKDRQQYKRRKNIVMWFLGFVIIALTLMLLIK